MPGVPFKRPLGAIPLTPGKVFQDKVCDCVIHANYAARAVTIRATLFLRPANSACNVQTDALWLAITSERHIMTHNSELARLRAAAYKAVADHQRDMETDPEYRQAYNRMIAKADANARREGRRPVKRISA